MTTPAAANFYLAKHLLEHEGRRIAIFNPHSKSLEELPVIMAFSNVKGGGEGIAYAIAEDGVVLGSHWCSHEGYVPADLGVLEGCCPDRHKTYQKHCPDGYCMEFIPSEDVMIHEKLSKAFELNQKEAEAKNAGSAPAKQSEGKR